MGALYDRRGPVSQKGFPESSGGIVAADARGAAEGLPVAVNDLRVEEDQDRRFPGLVESPAERNRGMTNKPTMVRAPFASLRVSYLIPHCYAPGRRSHFVKIRQLVDGATATSVHHRGDGLVNGQARVGGQRRK